MKNFVIRKVGAGLLLCCGLVGPVLAETCTDTTIPARNPDSVYVDNGNGTVTDTRTNLMWKRCAQGLTWDGTTCSGQAQYFTWSDALQQAADSTYAGYSDWRLPNVKELFSLVEECRIQPAINTTIFPNTPSAPAWSSTPAYIVQNTSWTVDFSTGFSYYPYGRETPQAVFLVRGGNTGADYGR